jgi:DHA2 family multidrug resistance protein
LVDHFRGLTFFTNIPIGIVATLLTMSLFRSPKYGEKLKANQVDWWGEFILTSFVGSLQFVSTWPTR